MNTLQTMLKRSAKGVLASNAGWRLASPLRGRGAVALMYHRVNGDGALFPGIPLAQFRAQMQWLRANCTPVSVEDMPDALARAARIRPPVLVTFDDGYRDYHDLAYPVLRELKIPATVFLATGCMDHGSMLWTDEIQWAMLGTRAARLALPWDRNTVLTLGDVASRTAAAAHCKAVLKKLPDHDRRTWVRELLEDLDVLDAQRYIGRQMLDWDEVRATREGTRFGGHSHTHPILSRLPSAEIREEIRTCRDRIAAETGEPPHAFAYPNGGLDDFDARVRAALTECRFDIAFSTVEGRIGARSDRLALPRQAAGGRTIGDFATLVGRP